MLASAYTHTCILTWLKSITSWIAAENMTPTTGGIRFSMMLVWHERILPAFEQRHSHVLRSDPVACLQRPRLHIIFRPYPNKHYFIVFIKKLQKSTFSFAFLSFSFSVFSILFLLSSSHMQQIHTCSLCNCSVSCFYFSLNLIPISVPTVNSLVFGEYAKAPANNFVLYYISRSLVFPIFVGINFSQRECCLIFYS
jgi:hypothetical protein